jgi:sulfate transport system substrate-binding protein
MRFRLAAKISALWALLLLTVVPTTLAQDNSITLTLAGYTTPREAYVEIIPLFQAYWLEQTGTSLVTLLVRPGNPRNIQDWVDLTQDGIEVVTPDPATSGGAQWNVLGAYGAAYRGNVEGYEAGEDGAYQLLVDLFSNVSVLDPSARDSVITFSNGIGDTLITYENEYYAGIVAGDEYDIVYPSSTILIENPVAVVDAYADAHGVREAAEAFVEFLFTPEAQAIFASKGYRPPVPIATISAAREAAEGEVVPLWEEGALDETLFPPVEDIFTIIDFGGWDEVGASFFTEDGIFPLAIADAQAQ